MIFPGLPGPLFFLKTIWMILKLSNICWIVKSNVLKSAKLEPTTEKVSFNTFYKL